MAGVIRTAVPLRPTLGVLLVTATLYFAAVFAFAFAMGVARVVVIAPRVGPTAAVLIEVPIVVAISWIVARLLLHGRTFGIAQRMAVGGIAFTFLIAGEALLASVMFGQSVGQWVAGIATPLGLAGLAGQVAFAMIPMLVRDRAGERAAYAR